MGYGNSVKDMCIIFILISFSTLNAIELKKRKKKVPTECFIGICFDRNYFFRKKKQLKQLKRKERKKPSSHLEKHVLVDMLWYSINVQSRDQKLP